MLHFAQWKLERHWNYNLLRVWDVWYLVHYHWEKKIWDFWITHLLEDATKSFVYYVFDSIEQKWLYEIFHKIAWVGPKTAYMLTWLDQSALSEAVMNNDTKFFEAIPWVGPKLAKRLLIELKSKVKASDLEQIDTGSQLYKTIIATLKPLGYTPDEIKKWIKNSWYTLIEENMKDIIKFVVGQR